MRSDTFRTRLTIAGATALVLFVLWPGLSDLWVAFLQSVGARVSDAGISPGTASTTLPVVVVVLMLFPRTVGKNLRSVSRATVLTLGAELTLVLLAGLTTPSADVLSLFGSIVQDAVPIGWLVSEVVSEQSRAGHRVPPAARE